MTKCELANIHVYYEEKGKKRKTWLYDHLKPLYYPQIVYICLYIFLEKWRDYPSLHLLNLVYDITPARNRRKSKSFSVFFFYKIIIFPSTSSTLLFMFLSNFFVHCTYNKKRKFLIIYLHLFLFSYSVKFYCIVLLQGYIFCIEIIFHLLLP